MSQTTDVSQSSTLRQSEPQTFEGVDVLVKSSVGRFLLQKASEIVEGAAKSPPDLQRMKDVTARDVSLENDLGFVALVKNELAIENRRAYSAALQQIREVVEAYYKFLRSGYEKALSILAPEDASQRRVLINIKGMIDRVVAENPYRKLLEAVIFEMQADQRKSAGAVEAIGKDTARRVEARVR